MDAMGLELEIIVKEYRVILENKRCIAYLCIISESEPAARKMLKNFLRSEAWKVREKREKEVGINSKYTLCSISEYGDAPASSVAEIYVTENRMKYGPGII